jgi:iron complex outermembrane receptor protein
VAVAIPVAARVRSNQNAEKGGGVNLPCWGGSSMKIRLESIHGVDQTATETVRSGPRNVPKRLVPLLAVTLLLTIPACSQEKPDDLANKSLEDLMTIEVTSVSKREQKISRAASVIFVISQEDIRRSGATNIPDLLRMVPGLDVAQINANAWAVSARGLNSRFSNELLVLLDGRSVYTPTFDGVLWDVLDLPLEDIERIEVIRGPGASVWATNAVNGVINIITRKASDTPGAMVVAGGGTVDQGFGTLQYGGSIGKDTSFRVFTKYFNQDHFPGSNGQDGGDGWNLSRAGFRSDTVLSSKDTLTFEGDLYRGREGDPGGNLTSITSPPLQDVQMQVNLGGGYLQAVWDHAYSSRSDSNLQLAYDEYERNDVLGETRGTFDIAFQHHIAWGDRQNLVWGVEYRNSDSRTVGSLLVSLDPPNLKTQLFSSFLQDEIILVPDRLFLTVGTKIEHDYYTGWDAQPSVRVAWTPNARRTIWAAVSDADRSPAAIDASIVNNLGGVAGPNGPAALRLLGNPNLENEKTIAYEAGYRMSLAEHLSLDFAAYYNDQFDQETTEPGMPFFEPAPLPPHLVLPLIYSNLMHGESHGFELATNWKVASRWTLSPGYAFEQIHMHLEPTSHDTTSVSAAEGSSPVHSAQLRSHLALAHNLSWDASVYFVDRLTDPVIPAYTRLDTGLTWQCNKKSSLSLVGQNLLKDRHPEFIDSTGSAATTLIKRSAYAKFSWYF